MTGLVGPEANSAPYVSIVVAGFVLPVGWLLLVEDDKFKLVTDWDDVMVLDCCAAWDDDSEAFVDAFKDKNEY